VTLVPRPVRPIPIYQAIVSEPTYHYVAKEGHIAVMPLGNRSQFGAKWQRYGQLVEQYRGRPVNGDDRVVVVQVHIGDTREEAFERFRPAHDERNRFLGAQRPVSGYLDEGGQPFGFGRLPTLEESVEQSSYFVGTAEQVRDGLIEVVTAHGIEQLVIEIPFAGMSKSLSEEQIAAFATDVRPALEAAAAQTANGTVAAR
jgi:alkanesulfonate monooxygenase SsuD/methylene tetrahydromethanopterin reductase-like flavin-dependent oxidoreductase (luciferase family)